MFNYSLILILCIFCLQFPVLYCQETGTSSLAALRSATTPTAVSSPGAAPSAASAIKHFLHSYSINGQFLKSERLTSAVGALTTSGQHLLLGMVDFNLAAQKKDRIVGSLGHAIITCDPYSQVKQMDSWSSKNCTRYRLSLQCHSTWELRVWL